MHLNQENQSNQKNISKTMQTKLDDVDVLFIEPFYGGSHKQLIDNVLKDLKIKYHLASLKPKKWHWRARCSAIRLSEDIPELPTCKVLFCSSVLSLAEFLGLRPDFLPTKKVVYFHENQLVYPVQNIKERDFQYGYNQITTCIAADIVCFNSHYNMDSFLENINKFFKIMPDYRPLSVVRRIKQKCRVLYYPMNFCEVPMDVQKRESPLHIAWAHRWEYDKGPAALYEVLLALKENNCEFKVSIMGETFKDVPKVFELMKTTLSNEIVNYGFIENKQEYYNILKSAHVFVSTAEHEFYGVSTLEAAYSGCFPLVPNKLVYPEIYDKICLYRSTEELTMRLKHFSKEPQEAVRLRHELQIDFNKFATLSEFLLLIDSQ